MIGIKILPTKKIFISLSEKQIELNNWRVVENGFIQIFSLMLFYARTRLKIEWLTEAEVLTIKEAKDLFHRMTYLRGIYPF